MQTYLFYDIETTGLSKVFDQVLQFAAIRTDLELNEMERYETYIRLNPDCIPSPKALITHYIGIQTAATGLNELEGIEAIHQWMNQAGTISLGYNTLGFDDEFLRFSFYRNLLPPYTHQYANQCGRMDLYPITALYYLVKNAVLQWPIVEGQPRLKLELLNQANHFVKGRSHHAMVDVEATLALAKKLRAETETWDYVLGYFNKQKDQERFYQLQNGIPNTSLKKGLLVDGSIGGKEQFIAPVLCLGEHTQNKNQMLWLRLDSFLFRELETETLLEKVWVYRKKWGEPGFILPEKPRFLSFLREEKQSLAEENLRFLSENPETLETLIHYHRNFLYPVIKETDPDGRLYLDGFLSNEDQSISKRFHLLKPKEKAELIEQMQNPRLQTLAMRVLARHFPETLNASQKKSFDTYLARLQDPDNQEPIVDFRGHSKLSPKQALADITELRQTDLNIEQLQLLDELENYLNRFLSVQVAGQK